MAIMDTDQADLVLPLFAGLQGVAPWDMFLARLMARTGADRVHLIDGGGTPAPRLHRRVATSGFGADDGAAELLAIGGPAPSLRPGRVYVLEELRELSPAARAAQDAALAAAAIADARILRIGTAPRAIWLVLLAVQGGFRAADSALLTNLAPAIAIAASQLETMHQLRLRADMAEGTLAAFGIAQAVVDESGAVLAADRLWQAQRSLVQALPEPPGSVDPPRLAQLGDGTAALLRALSGQQGALIAVRQPPTKLPQGAAAVLVQALALSPREAALAVRISEGQSLIEAGRALRLTDETTRNYSKRIYAKTGARGQADLVRIVLTSLAPLA